MGGGGEVTVFADTNLGTRIAFNVPPDITAASLKRDFVKEHWSCLPDIGEIQVNGLMVKRKSCFYYLPDSMPIKYVFPAMIGTWFLHVEVKHLNCSCVPCSSCDAAVLSKHNDLTNCNSEDKAKCNSEEKKMEGLQPPACSVEKHETTNHVSKNKKGIFHENHMQNTATGMSEKYPYRFEDKSTGSAIKSPYLMSEKKVENLVELHANSMQVSLSKMSTQVISVTGILNKYFSSFDGIDNFSCSSNSDVTSRAVDGGIEVHSNTGEHSCSKRQSDSLSQFTPKTPPHVLHAPPVHVDLVPKISECKSRKPKVGKHLQSRGRNIKSKVGRNLSDGKSGKSKIGKRLLSASRSLGVSIIKRDPTLSLLKFKDRKLLHDKSKITGSLFSISGDSDD